MRGRVCTDTPIRGKLTGKRNIEDAPDGAVRSECLGLLPVEEPVRIPVTRIELEDLGKEAPMLRGVGIAPGPSGLHLDSCFRADRLNVLGPDELVDRKAFFN